MFWVTDTERVADDQHTQPYSVTMETWKERQEVMESLNDRGWTYHGTSAYARKTSTSVLNRYWQTYFSDKNGIWCPHAAVPKATFSYATTEMDKVGGWSEEQWVGSNLAACMLTYTEAVFSKGRSYEPPLDLDFIQGIIVESVTWVTDGSLWQHEWTTDTSVTLRENEILEALNSEIDVPCPLQWGLLWFSAPTDLNQKFASNGTKMEKFRKIVNRAFFFFMCNFAVDRTHTPRAMFVRTVTVALCCAHDNDWNVKEEMQEWDVDDDRIAKLAAIHEKASRVSADNRRHWSSHKS